MLIRGVVIVDDMGLLLPTYRLIDHQRTLSTQLRESAAPKKCHSGCNSHPFCNLLVIEFLCRWQDEAGVPSRENRRIAPPHQVLQLCRTAELNVIAAATRVPLTSTV